MKKGASWRPEIEALRAVAVVMVLLFHAAIPGAAGGFAGVDVFFVISGYLITSLLLRELIETRSIRLGRFFANRVRRLLPSAALVLGASCALAWLFLPRITWQSIAPEALYSAFYGVNWHFAAESVDYLAEDEQHSPLQHYWSLAVEEQFYVVWPLALLVVAILARRRPEWAARCVALGLLLVACASFVYAMVLHQTGAPSAYFNTFARIWELAAGALLACVAQYSRPAFLRRFSWLAPWMLHLGFAGLLVSLVSLGGASSWPNAWTVLPVGSCVLVIAGGVALEHGGQPVAWPYRSWISQSIGRHSYALYLWHWPVVVVALHHAGRFSAVAPALAVLASVPFAVLTTRYLEEPIRRRRGESSRRTFQSVGLPATAFSVIAAVLLGGLAGSPVAEADPKSAQGARVLGLGESPQVGAIDQSPLAMTPGPLDARDDVPDAYADGCQADPQGDELVQCSYGDLRSDRVIGLVGDSKALQWLPAIDEIARGRGYRVVTYTKSGCSWTPTLTEFKGDQYVDCQSWGRAVMADLTARRDVKLIITSGQTGSEEAEAQPVGSIHDLVQGYGEYWRALENAGIDVVVLEDSPRPQISVDECVAEHPDKFMTECSTTIGTTQTPLEAAARRVQAVEFVDLTEWICPAQRCVPVIGNVLIFRQGAHLTATYVRSLEPLLRSRLAAAPGERG